MWLSFFLGLAFGSFINVLIFRFHPEKENEQFIFLKTVSGRSHCDACGKVLQWFELIPVLSFLLQRGRCRGCRAKLSWQYPLIELITGISFALVYWRLVGLPGLISLWRGWFWVYLWFWWLIVVDLIAVAAFDFRYYLIPSFLLEFLWLLGVGINLFYLFQGSPVFKTGLYFSGHYFYLLGGDNWLSRLLPAIIFGWGTIGSVYLFSRGRAMGLGDLWLVTGLGLIFGWPDILWGLVLAFIFGTIVSLILIFLKRKTLKDFIPFAPFLALGAMTIFLFGDKILLAYLSIFPAFFLQQ